MGEIISGRGQFIAHLPVVIIPIPAACADVEIIGSK